MKKRMGLAFLVVFPTLLFIYSFVLVPEVNPAPDKEEAINRTLNALERIRVVEKEAQEEAPLPKEAVTLPVEAAPQPEKEKIIIDTLELRDMDIVDVLKLLSKKSGLNIVAGKNVRARITIFLKNVDVRDILRIILETNDLAYEEEGNIIKVITSRDYELTYGNRFGDKSQVKIIPLQYSAAADLVPILTQVRSSIGKVLIDEKSNTMVLIDTPSKISDMQDLIKEIDVPVVTQVFNLNYANAEDMEKKVSEVLTRNVGKIKVDKRSNKVYITDTPAKIKEVSSIISAFDERHRQVLIEAKIVKVVLSDEYKMGVDWQRLLNQYHSLNMKGVFSILSSTDKKGQFSIGTIGTDDYSVVVEALNTVGNTNILSSPRITALNNEEAKIMVGSTEPYVTSTTTTSSTGPSNTAESVTFIDVGVKLFVTPTINQDSFITMKIKPEVSSVSGHVVTSQNNKIPIIDTTTAETTVMVKDGVTIVIGGLIKDETIETINKVPLFGDLPLLGFVFRNKDRSVKKTELVVFLTPHIVTGDYDSYVPPKKDKGI